MDNRRRHLQAAPILRCQTPAPGQTSERDDADELLDELVLALQCRCELLLLESVDDTERRGREASLVCLRCGRRWVRQMA